MALTDKVEWFVGVQDDGLLEIRKTRIILEDGVEISKLHDRRVLEPGANTAGLPQKIRQIAQLVWNPDMVFEYTAKKRAVSKPLSIQR